MGFLNKLVRFVLMQIAAIGFMLIAPLLYLVPFIFVVLTPHSDVFSTLALGMMLTGPFVSAFWMMMVCMFRRYRRSTTDGSSYECSLEGSLAATGWMLLGFFGTLVAELVFLFVFHVPRDGDTLGWALWFATAPLVIFSPLIIFVCLGNTGETETATPKRVRSAKTIAIDKNYEEARDIILKLRREGRFDGKSDKGYFSSEILDIAESALTEEQWGAFKFRTIADDPVEMRQRESYRSGTIGEKYFYAPYQQYLYETGRSDNAPPVFPEDEPTKVEVETKNSPY